MGFSLLVFRILPNNSSRLKNSYSCSNNKMNSYKTKYFSSLKKMNSCFKNYSNALTSTHPRGVTPGTYVVSNFWAGTEALDHFFTSKARYTWKDLWDLNIAAILKMKDLDCRDWVLPLNSFQNGHQEKGFTKCVLCFSRKSVPFCWLSFPNIVKIFFGRNL